MAAGLSLLGGAVLGYRIQVDSGSVTDYVALLKCSRLPGSSFPLYKVAHETSESVAQ